MENNKEEEEQETESEEEESEEEEEPQITQTFTEFNPEFTESNTSLNLQDMILHSDEIIPETTDFQETEQRERDSLDRPLYTATRTDTNASYTTNPSYSSSGDYESYTETETPVDLRRETRNSLRENLLLNMPIQQNPFQNFMLQPEWGQSGNELREFEREQEKYKSKIEEERDELARRRRI